MKKQLLLFTTLAIACIAQAQSGKVQVQVQGEFAIPDKIYAISWGGYVKGAYGLNDKSQLTFTAGYSRYHLKGNPNQRLNTTSLLPFLAGYKYIYKGFYLEPQLGYGEFGGKRTLSVDDVETRRISEGAFMAAIGAGYTIKRLDVGVRHQWAQSLSEHVNHLRITGFHVGYLLVK